MIRIAREDMKITGFTGAREVQDRLAEIKRQFSEYIKNQKIILPFYHTSVSYYMGENIMKGKSSKYNDLTLGDFQIKR